MSKNKKLEYWVFIDDSGNIELSSKEEYFIYGALVFNSIEDVQSYRTEHEKTLKKLFQKNKEIKASANISWTKRKEIFNTITNSNCKLLSVIEEKKLSKRLLQIENDYSNNLKKVKQLPLKSKLILKKIRQEQYAYHKGYLIAQLICLVVQNIKKQRNMKINIIIDNENLNAIKDNFTDYLKYEQKYLKFRSYHYSFDMKDSKDDYCLQGSDFFANAIYRSSNKNEREKYNYINEKKEIIIKTFPYILETQFEKTEKEHEVQTEKKQKIKEHELISEIE